MRNSECGIRNAESEIRNAKFGTRNSESDRPYESAEETGNPEFIMLNPGFKNPADRMCALEIREV